MDRVQVINVVSEATTLWLRFCYANFPYLKPKDLRGEVMLIASLNDAVSRRDMIVLCNSQKLTIALLLSLIGADSGNYQAAQSLRAELLESVGYPELIS